TDVTDLAAEERNPLLMKYLESDFNQGLLNRQPEIDQEWRQVIDKAEADFIKLEQSKKETWKVAVERITRSVFMLPNLRQRLGLVYGRGNQPEAGPPSELDPRLLALLEKSLAEAKRTTDSWGGSLYFVYMPTWVHFAHPEQAYRNRDLVLKIVKDLNLH